jgi:hypothetical protein
MSEKGLKVLAREATAAIATPRSRPPAPFGMFQDKPPTPGVAAGPSMPKRHSIQPAESHQQMTDRPKAGNRPLAPQPKQ